MARYHGTSVVLPAREAVRREVWDADSFTFTAGVAAGEQERRHEPYVGHRGVCVGPRRRSGKAKRQITWRSTPAPIRQISVLVGRRRLADRRHVSDVYRGILPSLSDAARSVLGETTEVYGAEHLLTRRARNREVGERLVERIRWWEEYTALWGASIDNNPSPGNKAGGLTTIYEKSLGAVAKAGSTPLNQVVGYAERVTERGLVHMDTPGYDPVSATGQVAGGCTLVAFTTGRGSAFGFKPAPSLKIATSSELYERQEPDMDVDAGKVLAGVSLDELGEEIFEELLAVASGKQTKSELAGIGTEEFNPWLLGATL